MLERRRRVLRAIGGGVVLGAAAALTLALCELGYVAALAREAFGRPADFARFGLYELLILLLGGAVFGLLIGVVAGLVAVAAAGLSRRRTTAAEWTARLYTILATPAIALFCALAFQGRRARTLPHKDLLALALGLLCLGLFYLIARVTVRAKERMGRGHMGRSAMVVVAAGLLGLAVALYVADQRVLPRLYGFLHVGLAALAFAAAELGVGTVYLLVRRIRPRIMRLCEPSFAAMLFLAAMAGGLAAVGALGRAESLRFVVFERSALLAKTLRLLAAVHTMPARHLAPTIAAPAVPEEPTILGAGPRLPGADLFVITIDALRADHVGAYGYRRPTTPRIDELAGKSVVFERAYAQVPHTSFSLATLLTGKYVYALTALGGAARHETLAEMLRPYRYKTAAFYPPSVFYIDEKRFTTYQASSFGFEYVKFEYLDAEKRVDQIARFLETEKPARTFVWVHFFEPHEPYEVHPGIDFGGSALDRYDGEIAYVDRAVGRLLEIIRRQRPRAIIVVTADHGEEFGEHGGRYHGTALYDEQVRVPLIVEAPGVEPRRVGGQVASVDLGVTLLGLLDVTPSARMRGTNLGPWLGDPPARDGLLPPAFAEIETKKMVVDAERKLVCDLLRDYCELYELARDPGERHNVIDQEPEVAARLRGRLEQWIGSHSRLEAETDFRNQDDARRKALERARLGDRAAVPDLLPLLESKKPEMRREVARLLARLPEDQRARPALLRALGDGEAGQWAAAALARSCNPDARRHLRELRNGDAELEARAGLALSGCRDEAFPQLEAGLRTDDITLRREVLLAIGHSGDPRAVDLLLGHLDAVLERPHVVEALGMTGSSRAAAPLAERVLTDPYVNVRENAVRALGRVDGAHAAVVLRRALAEEKELPVQAALVAELHRLGALEGAVEGSAGRVHAIRGELFIGARPGAKGVLEVLEPAAAAARADIRPGTSVYRFAVPRGTTRVRVGGPAAFLLAR